MEQKTSVFCLCFQRGSDQQVCAQGVLAVRTSAPLSAEGHCSILKAGDEGWWWGWSTWAISPLGLLPAMLCVVSAEAEPALGAKPFPVITDGTALVLFISACPSQKLNLWMKGIAVHRARRVHADLTFRTTFCSYRDATFITPLLAILFSIQLKSTAPFFPIRAAKKPSKDVCWWSSTWNLISFPSTHQTLYFWLLLAYVLSDLGAGHCFSCPGFTAEIFCACTKMLVVQQIVSHNIMMSGSSPGLW